MCVYRVYVGVGIQGNEVGVYLRYFEGKKPKVKLQEQFFSNLDIDKMCNDVHFFMSDLNRILVKNFDVLPLKIRSTTQKT